MLVPRHLQNPKVAYNRETQGIECQEKHSRDSGDKSGKGIGIGIIRATPTIITARRKKQHTFSGFDECTVE